MKTEVTTDYTLFKTINGNRPISQRHVKRLIESIREQNLLAENPIIVNEKMEVIDGQHRLYAATELQTPIYYTVKKGADLETVQLINDNLRPWGNVEFLNSFVQRDFEEYKILEKFVQKYDLGITISIGVLMDNLGSKGHGEIMVKFKKGEFKVKDLPKAITFAEQIAKLGAYIEGNFYKSFPFVRALQIAYQETDPDFLRQRIAQSGIKLRKRPTVREYLMDLEEIVNFRQKKNIIRFLRTKEVKKAE